MQEVIHIDSYFNSAMGKISIEGVFLWVILSGAVGVVTWILCKRQRISKSSAVLLPLLLFYLCFTFTITVVKRFPWKYARYELELFWSYKAAVNGRTELLWENFWNVMLFIPIGCMVAGILKKHPWMGIIIGAVLSAGIEGYQLLAHRGLFEFDDIFHNTAGAVIGTVLYLILRRASIN